MSTRTIHPGVIPPERLQELGELFRAANRAVGIPDDYEPEMTVQEVRAEQLTRGIRPEDNAASREMIRMRYGGDPELE
jgi:hypothetical protein